jgi:Spy/CpxP family protein refolding chaperone
MQKDGFVAVLLALVSAALLAAPLAAKQEESKPAQKLSAVDGGRVIIEQLERDLKLTEAQKTQPHAIYQDVEKQSSDILQDNLLSSPEKEERMKALRQSVDTRIKSILTSIW